MCTPTPLLCENILGQPPWHAALQVSGYAIPAANLVERVRLRMDAASLSGSWHEQQWRQLTAPLHEAGVPWAAILGEHAALAKVAAGWC